ncbi:MAG: replication factor C small subunit [Candidatus Aenigmatarchaeota archaeon]|nr:MAG: replication factor C small subunit [Candidatus Aenigmarchaeota archaeon]
MEIWTEKYRPKKLDDVINQKHVVERLKAWVKEGSIPNMLFAGPAGVGKTTVALCLAMELFGENWRQNFQETNASDDRGIGVVRGRIKEFAKIKPIGSEFKIIFLDESDALTPEAQQALRRTMESFSGVCRFILSANYSSKIIEPIQSRCAVFRFKRLGEDDVKEYLKRIIQNEKLKVDDEALNAIYEISGGDLRKATNLLQACATFDKITKEVVYEVSSQAKPEDVKEMIKLVLKGKFPDARKKLYTLLIDQGLSGEDIIKEIHRQIFDLELDEKAKLELIEKTAEFEFRLNQGGSEDIQLEALLAQFLKYA